MTIHDLRNELNLKGAALHRPSSPRPVTPEVAGSIPPCAPLFPGYAARFKPCARRLATVDPHLVTDPVVSRALVPVQPRAHHLHHASRIGDL